MFKGEDVRAHVYRNLDQPFRLFGLSPGEIVALCVVFVITGEMLLLIEIPRFWAIVPVIGVSLFVSLVRRLLGDQFIARSFRFVFLPRNFRQNLIRSRRSA